MEGGRLLEQDRLPKGVRAGLIGGDRELARLLANAIRGLILTGPCQSGRTRVDLAKVHRLKARTLARALRVACALSAS
jgi:hypothetical protein